MVPPQMKTPEGCKVANLNRQVGNLIAADVKLHQTGHLADLLRQADQLVVVGHQALEVDEAAHRGRQIGQLVPAETKCIRIEYLNFGLRLVNTFV